MSSPSQQETDERRAERGSWTSEPAFIYSMAAASVGLGNLWRFPYIAGEQGGGAFILAYLVCILAIGLPLMFMEVGYSRDKAGGPVRAMSATHRWGVWVGWGTVLVTTAITSYYLVVTGWTMGYAVDAVRGVSQEFDGFTSGYAPLAYFAIVTILGAAILARGIDTLERFSRYMVPLLFLAIIGLVITGLMSEGRAEAIEFMLAPDFSRLASPGLWFFALGQAFYSLAIGQGYLLTYGSFVGRDTSVPRAAGIVGGADVAVALLAGWMIFPIVFAHGLEPAAGSELAFSTLPLAFEAMGGGALFAAVFFPLLFVAAFSSSIAGMKVLTTTLRDEFSFTLPRAVIVVAVGMLILGTPSALSYSAFDLSVAGEPVLDLVDRMGGTYVVVVLGVVTGAAIAWSVHRREEPLFPGRIGSKVERAVVVVGRVLPFVAFPLVVATLLW
jgi:neurotransmitter:Na+ symporter, NSS family